jgi:hypothetical protein
MKRHCEESSRRWNFDFEGERPLAGRFAWKIAPAAEIGAAAATVFVPPSLVPARLSPAGQPQQPALDNRENMAEVGGRRAAGVRSSAATPPIGFSASSSFIAGGGVDLLAGSPAGSLDDLRTPAPPSPRGTEPTAAQVARGTEPAAAQAANRLSDSTRAELGARPKTKEQKITGRKIIILYSSAAANIYTVPKNV